jgi:hypothetical protein
MKLRKLRDKLYHAIFKHDVAKEKKFGSRSLKNLPNTNTPRTYDNGLFG